MAACRYKPQLLFQTHPSHPSMSCAEMEESDAFTYRMTSSYENNYNFGHHHCSKTETSKICTHFSRLLQLSVFPNTAKTRSSRSTPAVGSWNWEHPHPKLGRAGMGGSSSISHASQPHPPPPRAAPLPHLLSFTYVVYLM